MKFKNDNHLTHFVHFALKASAEEIRDLKRREASARTQMEREGKVPLLPYQMVVAPQQARRYARALNILNAWAKGRPFSSAERCRYGEVKFKDIHAKAGIHAGQIYGVCFDRADRQKEAITVAEHILQARQPYGPIENSRFRKWISETPESEDAFDRLVAKAKRRKAV